MRLIDLLEAQYSVDINYNVNLKHKPLYQSNYKLNNKVNGASWLYIYIFLKSRQSDGLNLR